MGEICLLKIWFMRGSYGGKLLWCLWVENSDSLWLLSYLNKQHRNLYKGFHLTKSLRQVPRGKGKVEKLWPQLFSYHVWYYIKANVQVQYTLTLTIDSRAVKLQIFTRNLNCLHNFQNAPRTPAGLGISPKIWGDLQDFISVPFCYAESVVVMVVYKGFHPLHTYLPPSWIYPHLSQ